MDNKTKRKLRKLAGFISKLPKRRFNMDSYSHRKNWGNGDKDSSVCEETVNECGTTCCIAGWAIVNAGYCLNADGEVLTKSGRVKDLLPDRVASNLLGISGKEASKLFYYWNWPKDKSNCPIFKSTPKGAAKRIIHLVETGE